jgi:chemotaxis protein methyltransferase CheR
MLPTEKAAGKMSTADFNRLSSFIQTTYGIKMPPLKKTLLESRLQKRLHALRIPSYREYCDYVFSQQGQSLELVSMLDVITTNKTDFFREPGHFDYLIHHGLPAYQKSHGDRNHPLRMWSAGCSTGEEPYSLAMVMSEFAESSPPGLHYSILGTDLSTRVLGLASNAVYASDRIAAISLLMKKKYFLRSKNLQQPTVRIVPQLRQKVNFQRLNFMDNTYEVPGLFDVVFCRNVLIYFDKPTQEKVINRLCARLNEGGLFFLGHSESITGMQVPLQQIRPTIFKRI